MEHFEIFQSLIAGLACLKNFNFLGTESFYEALKPIYDMAKPEIAQSFITWIA